MGKYDHLEELRSKIAARMRSKKMGDTLTALWVEFDQCIKEFKPSCEENKCAIDKLKKLQIKIKKAMGVEEVKNV